MQMRRIQVIVDRVPLAVTRIGQGVPVVCLSATGHDAADFSQLALRVGEQCELLCIEWPGHGHSGLDHCPASAARYSELVDGVMSALGLGAAVLLGNSIGGAAAILCAARRPVRALVLCDSGGLLAVTGTVRRFCGLFEKFFAAGERGAWWYQPLFAAYYRLVLPQRAAAAQRRSIVAQARARAPALRQAWASFGRADADIRTIAAGLNVPIWIAWGKQDRIISLGACLPAIRQFKHYTLDIFDAGHAAFLEQPDQFAEKFLSFIAGLAPSEAAISACEMNLRVAAPARSIPGLQAS
jgi:pimeloyl-ACP methyl ester carboxylesterase